MSDHINKVKQVYEQHGLPLDGLNGAYLQEYERSLKAYLDIEIIDTAMDLFEFDQLEDHARQWQDKVLEPLKKLDPDFVQRLEFPADRSAVRAWKKREEQRYDLAPKLPPLDEIPQSPPHDDSADPGFSR